MTLSRRGALRAAVTALALLIPAVTWWLINTWAYDGSMRLTRIRNGEVEQFIIAKEVAKGHRAPVFPSSEEWYATGWAQHWQIIGPGLFLLLGAALLALALRRSVRGAWWVLPAAAPAFAAGYVSLGQAVVHTAAGWGVSSYTTQGSQNGYDNKQGLHLQGLHGPAWLLGVTAAVGWAMILLPAACAPRRDEAPALSRVALRVSLLTAVLTGVFIAAAQYVNSSGGPVGAGSRGFVGAAFVAFAGAVLLHGGPGRLRSAAWFAVAAWALVVGSTSVAAGQLANAVVYAVALLTAAALSLVPWTTLRARLNARATPASL